MFASATQVVQGQVLGNAATEAMQFDEFGEGDDYAHLRNPNQIELSGRDQEIIGQQWVIEPVDNLNLTSNQQKLTFERLTEMVDHSAADSLDRIGTEDTGYQGNAANDTNAPFSHEREHAVRERQTGGLTVSLTGRAIGDGGTGVGGYIAHDESQPFELMERYTNRTDLDFIAPHVSAVNNSEKGYYVHQEGVRLNSRALHRRAGDADRAVTQQNDFVLPGHEVELQRYERETEKITKRSDPRVRRGREFQAPNSEDTGMYTDSYEAFRAPVLCRRKGGSRVNNFDFTALDQIHSCPLAAPVYDEPPAFF